MSSPSSPPCLRRCLNNAYLVLTLSVSSSPVVINHAHTYTPTVPVCHQATKAPSPTRKATEPTHLSSSIEFVTKQQAISLRWVKPERVVSGHSGEADRRLFLRSGIRKRLGRFWGQGYTKQTPHELHSGAKQTKYMSKGYPIHIYIHCPFRVPNSFKSSLTQHEAHFVNERRPVVSKRKAADHFTHRLCLHFAESMTVSNGAGLEVSRLEGWHDTHDPVLYGELLGLSKSFMVFLPVAFGIV